MSARDKKDQLLTARVEFWLASPSGDLRSKKHERQPKSQT
jgi:hypothetical protein